MRKPFKSSHSYGRWVFIALFTFIFSGCGEEKSTEIETRKPTAPIAIENVAQDKMTISKAVTTFLNAIEQQQTDVALSMTHPGLYSTYSREQVKASLESMYNNPDIEVSLINSGIDSISAMQTVDSADYHIINYSYDMLTRFPNANMTILEQMENTYRIQYGDENVEFNVATKTFKIHMESVMFAVFKPEYDNWKFLEYRPGREKVLNALVPIEVSSRVD